MWTWLDSNQICGSIEPHDKPSIVLSTKCHILRLEQSQNSNVKRSRTVLQSRVKTLWNTICRTVRFGYLSKPSIKMMYPHDAFHLFPFITHLKFDIGLMMQFWKGWKFQIACFIFPNCAQKATPSWQLKTWNCSGCIKKPWNMFCDTQKSECSKRTKRAIPLHILPPPGTSTSLLDYWRFCEFLDHLDEKAKLICDD